MVEAMGVAATSETLAAIRESGRLALSEREGLNLLSSFGVRVPAHALVTNTDELNQSLSEMSFPVVLKVDSADIAHKSDVGGVRVGCRSAEEAERAFAEILSSVERACPTATIGGVLVEEQIEGTAECFIGAHHDPEFGPVIGFGLGGIFVELIGDLVWRAAPVDHGEALRMIHESRALEVLAGWRGKPPADMAALASAIANVSDLVWALRAEVAEMDVNPLIVGPAGAVAADSFVLLKHSDQENVLQRETRE